MTDSEYERLVQRVDKGKAWIEKIKQQGKYWTVATAPHIRVWMDLGELLLREDARRGLIPGTADSENSQAWIAMKDREAKEAAKRARRKPRNTHNRRGAT